MQETNLLHLLEEHSAFLFIMGAILILVSVLLTAAWFTRRAERKPKKRSKRDGTQ
ncbi:MAG: hypothetical protein UZ17_ACD001002917 [Acidobacteria bacterium OLB17]|nr:MAG: hypothetical protein UZ17_ACD001002917 [Acidobacteria bacterium OLB17]